MTPSNRPKNTIDHLRSAALRTLFAAALAGLAEGRAQAPASSPPADTTATAASNQAAGSAQPTVTLNPFEVREESDTSYGAINSNSITRFNTELNKLPLSADVFDQAFMDDVGATSVESMIETYSAGAGFSGSDPASQGASGSATAQPGDHVSHGNIQLRGFGTPRIERDSLMPVGSFYNPGSTSPNNTSNFDIERVDVIDGPQALLYSGGGAGGVINVTSKQARFGQPTSGSATFLLDQHGSKTGELDYGTGTDNVALRFDLINQTQDTRRIFIGDQMQGYYLQLAVKLGNTTIRLAGEQTNYSGDIGNVTVFDAGSATVDSRESDQLRYLLATNTAGAVNPANGTIYGAGAVDNGRLNWSNVDSELGWQSSNKDINTFETLTVDSRWSSWLSTEFQLGYNTVKYDLVLPQTLDYYSPVDASNTLKTYAIGDVPGDQYEPGRSKGVRFSAVATNDLFDHRAQSQTVFGADFVRSDAGAVEYTYFQADNNFNVLVNPATIATNDGRTIMPKQLWSIANGLVQYPLFSPGSAQVNLGGVNYVRQIQNQINPTLVSAADPLGTTNTATYEVSKLFNKGIFAANYTTWLDGRLTSLLGVRLAQAYDQSITASGNGVARGKTTNLDVGLNYELVSWLRVYGDYSSAYEPPQAILHDPTGATPAIAQANSGEVGLKFSNAANTVSGSLSFYHTRSKNEQYEISTTLQNDINPTGLNGIGGAGQWVDLNRESSGVNLTMTANPLANWRMRLSAADSDGTILNSKVYGQLYNDQFHENSSGQVTFADGTVVFVPPTFNSKTLTEASTVTGAIPLTVAAMSTPGNAYYATPLVVTGQITATSNVASVLKFVDPTHGAILTGAVNLPVSNYQLNPALSGVTPAGSILVANAGDKTLGYPQYAVNFTNKYTFASGWIKGFSLGGTVGASWKYGEYYYYPAGIAAGTRAIFSAPTTTRFDLIVGYTRRFKKVTWSTQMNVYNLFNHYTVLILPNETTGYGTIANLNATFFGQPRSYQWSNTLKF